MFGWEFPPQNSGGLGTACFGICKAMARQQVEMIFVLPRRQPVAGNNLPLVFAGLEEIRFETVDTLLYPYVTDQSYAEHYQDIEPGPYGPTLFDEVIAYGKRARSIARKHSFDIIHAHDWLSFPAGLAAKRISGKPLIIHVHATEFDRSGGAGVNEKVYAIEREGMEQADGIIAISHWTKNIIIKHYGIPEEKIRVVHNGIDSDDIVLIPESLHQLKRVGKKMILFLGRITLQKGPDYFLAAAARVLELRDDVFFVVAGSGDMERAMIRRAAELGIADRVLFAGFLRGAEAQAMYQAADLFVMPSVSEPFGLTPLESLVVGTPVLVSKQSGVSEVLHHAIKADFWDIDEMTNKMVALLREPALSKTLTENGHREALSLTWDRSVAGYVDYYKTILNKLRK